MSHCDKIRSRSPDSASVLVMSFSAHACTFGALQCWQANAALQLHILPCMRVPHDMQVNPVVEDAAAELQAQIEHENAHTNSGEAGKPGQIV